MRLFACALDLQAAGPVNFVYKLGILFLYIELFKNPLLSWIPDEEFDCKSMVNKYTLDAIATCGYGVEINSFKDPDSIFARQVKS